MEKANLGWDRKTSFFWFAVGLFITVKACKLGVGTLSYPEPGFIFFGSGILLCILSIVVFIGTLKPGGKQDQKSLWEGMNWRNPVFIAVVLILYGYFFDRVGFLIACFLLTLFLLKVIGHMKWLSSVVDACLISLCAYLIFDVLLKCSLPKGILPF